MFGVGTVAHVRPSVNFKGTQVGRRPITPCEDELSPRNTSRHHGPRCTPHGDGSFDSLRVGKQYRRSHSMLDKISHCCFVAKEALHAKSRWNVYKTLVQDGCESETENNGSILKLPTITLSAIPAVTLVQANDAIPSPDARKRTPWLFEHLLLVQHLPDKPLLNILRFLSVRDIINCQKTCKRIDHLITIGAAFLPKITIEQLKFHFEDGEVLLYSDDNLCEEVRRHVMPSSRQLPALLRHLTIRSLFLRGLIPEETRPILHRLVDPTLRIDPSELYFLWCNFGSDIADRGALIGLCHRYAATIRRLAFEECCPPVAVSDQTIIAAGELDSLSVSSDGRHGAFPISDAALLVIAAQRNIFTTVDLSHTQITSDGVLALVKAWAIYPTSNATINLYACKFFKLTTLLTACQTENIVINSNRQIQINGYTLTLCIQ